MRGDRSRDYAMAVDRTGDRNGDVNFDVNGTINSDLPMAHCLVLLVTHGSSDRRHGLAAQSLCERLQDWFVVHNFHNLTVEKVALEGDDLSLADQVMAKLEQGQMKRQDQQYDRAIVLPLFLVPGVHVMEDIPAQVALVRQQMLRSGLQAFHLSVMPFLGDWPSLRLGMLEHLDPVDASPAPGIQVPVIQAPGTQTILLAHGSRRPGALKPLETIADQLGMTLAYWLVEPKLDYCLEQCIDQGATVIQIHPYFLFSGGISDAIDRLIQGVIQRYPQVTVVMHALLADRAEFVEMLGQECIQFVMHEAMGCLYD
jgi:sirohydrochlorin cobaltochelatase